MRNALKQHPLKAVQAALRQPNVQLLIVLILFALLATLLLGITLLPSTLARAASLPPEGQSCSTHPTAPNCNEQDPITRGCVADAQTLQVVPIMRQGSKVGQIEMRYSSRCHSYWGRSFSFSAGYAEIDMIAPFQENITGTWTGTYLAAYTSMVFEQRPALVGWVNFTATNHASATIA